MKWPELVPDAICTTPVTIHLEADGVNEDGSQKSGKTIQAMCNYQRSGKWTIDDERRLIQLQSTALFNGDIAPELETLVGTITVGDSANVWAIHSYCRARNPDGTVNFTRLEVI